LKNGKARTDLIGIEGHKIREGQIIESACPMRSCDACIRVKGDEHIYGKELIKCAEGHEIKVYYRSNTDTYLLEAVKIA